MSKIKLLDKSVYNRIAAGEVVERPLSIVKELVENSIDAGATAISVAIEDGGMKKICVSDNGSGILPEDVPTAFFGARHQQNSNGSRSRRYRNARFPRRSSPQYRSRILR